MVINRVADRANAYVSSLTTSKDKSSLMPDIKKTKNKAKRRKYRNSAAFFPPTQHTLENVKSFYLQRAFAVLSSATNHRHLC